MKPEEFKEIEELYERNVMRPSTRDENYLFKYLNESERLPSNKRRRYFYASDATRCERSLAWAVTGVSKSNGLSDKSLKIFALGDAIHEQLSKRYTKIPGWKFYEEHPGEIHIKKKDRDDFLLSYRVDGVMIREDWAKKDLFGIDTDKFICEFKSIADFPYSTGRNRNKMVYWYGAQDIPKYDHFAQLQIGMYGEGVEYGILHYHNKNNSEEATHIIKLDVEYTEKLIERLWKIQKEANDGNIPDRPFMAYPNRTYTDLMKTKRVEGKSMKTAWQCMFCDWRDKCWKLNEFKEEE
jgi:hypothetical protein